MHLLIGLVLLALGGGAAGAGEEEAVSGYLVDMMCALPMTTHSEDIPDFGYIHDRDCLRQDVCAKSGYAVLTVENRLLAFDAGGNQKAAEWLRTTDRQIGFQGLGPGHRHRRSSCGEHDHVNRESQMIWPRRGGPDKVRPTPA